MVLPRTARRCRPLRATVVVLLAGALALVAPGGGGVAAAVPSPTTSAGSGGTSGRTSDETDYMELVDPFVSTAGDDGNDLPGAQAPHGLAKVNPMTTPGRNHSGYDHDVNHIAGFTATNLDGVGGASRQRINLAAAMAAHVTVNADGSVTVTNFADATGASVADAAAITVGGVPIDGFGPEVSTYVVDRPKNTGIPAVSAVPAGSGARVKATYGGPVLSSAGSRSTTRTIRVTSANGSVTRTYTVGFQTTDRDGRHDVTADGSRRLRIRSPHGAAGRWRAPGGVPR
ncbi:hypothetical protein ABZ871_10755 [Streptomyces populi]